MRTFFSLPTVVFLAAMLLSVPAVPQAGAPGAPPAVGVVKAEFKPMAESTEINGRIEARNRVDLIARVTAFLNERLFTEGADVKKGQLLYRLERAPFEADVEVKEAETRYKDDPKTRDAEVARIKKKVHYPDADWKAVVDHMEHVMKVGGPQSVGIGTDYDGIEDPPTGLEDVSKLPKLSEELLRRGHSEEEVRGVLGENFLKFWDRAEAARKAMAPGLVTICFCRRRHSGPPSCSCCRGSCWR